MPRPIVIPTRAAPSPFQGAPYSQAIKAGDFVFVSGQLGLKPGETSKARVS
jgi:enamine deaminase RidA (YjgF/YER057c/UK114 family)